MAKENETIADIVAEMRGDGHTGPADALEWVRIKLEYYADRFEAAHKRMEWTHKKELETRDAVIQTEVAAREAEREAHKRELDELKKQVGNAAKLREALVSVKKSIDEMGAASLDGDPEIMLMSLTQVCARLSARIDTALAAPPRNCDVGTAEEQIERWQAFCNRYDDDCTGCPCDAADTWNYTNCFAKWAQLPYESGAAK